MKTGGVYFVFVNDKLTSIISSDFTIEYEPKTLLSEKQIEKLER